MIEGNFLLTQVSFSAKDELPFLRLQKDDSSNFVFSPEGVLTLAFDMSSKTCCGWHDLTTGENFACPELREVEPKYHQCPECQNKTGFNPAFYNTDAISQQQAERNKKPHSLYLAYFAPDSVKVGISFGERGNARLLEQGARNAFVLDIFPTATVARQYEAKISNLDGILESVQLNKKMRLLTDSPYSQKVAEETLEKVLQKIEAEAGLKFPNYKKLDLSDKMLSLSLPESAQIEPATDGDKVSGEYIGMIGSIIILAQQGRYFALPLKKYLGRKVKITPKIETAELSPMQVSLF